MWITYDPTAPFPQTPRPGVGIIDTRGQHHPPPGLASFEVEPESLTLGTDNDDIEAFYTVTGPGVLTPKETAAVDAIKADRARPAKITEAIDEASRRRQAVLDSVTPGGLADYVSLMGRALAGVRREAKGRAKPGEADRLDALEALSNQIEAIDTARDTIIAEIGQHADPASYDVPGSPHWP